MKNLIFYGCLILVALYLYKVDSNEAHEQFATDRDFVVEKLKLDIDKYEFQMGKIDDFGQTHFMESGKFKIVISDVFYIGSLRHATVEKHDTWAHEIAHSRLPPTEKHSARHKEFTKKIYSMLYRQ
jgi:hypothetical protein